MKTSVYFGFIFSSSFQWWKEMHINNDFRWQFELEVSWHLLDSIIVHVLKPIRRISKEFLSTKISRIFLSHSNFSRKKCWRYGPYNSQRKEKHFKMRWNSVSFCSIMHSRNETFDKFSLSNGMICFHFQRHTYVRCLNTYSVFGIHVCLYCAHCSYVIVICVVVSCELWMICHLNTTEMESWIFGNMVITWFMNNSSKFNDIGRINGFFFCSVSFGYCCCYLVLLLYSIATRFVRLNMKPLKHHRSPINDHK